jgi:short-subunit dehydrogenase
MALSLKPLSDQVVVITGASSGIGLATARMAASQGASVVLAARTEEALNRAVQEIAARGGKAIALACDVGRREDLEQVAAEAIRSFGRIDTWVNNAGVGIWGRIEEVSESDMRQLFETNFWGQVQGSLVALPHLRRRGGALINVGSIASDRAIPLQGIYSASKHAIKGFTDALRMELEQEGARVSVTLIKPGSIGTPMPQHVRNYTNSEPKFPPPVYAPEDVARVILHAASHPTRDAFVGGAARTISTLAKIAPRVLDRVSERTLFKGQLGPKPPSAGDNLWNGFAEGKVRGDHQGRAIRPSLYSNAALHPFLSTVAAGLAIGTIGWLATSRRRESGQSGRRYDTGPRYLEQPGRLGNEAVANPEIVPLLDETVLVETTGTGIELLDDTVSLTPAEARRVAEESGVR